MERKCNGRIGSGGNRIQDSREIFDSFKKGIQWRRGGISKGARVKKIGAMRKNNEEVCARIQEGSKRKWV